MQLTPVRQVTVEPGWLLPENFTGAWVNTANIDADVVINSMLEDGEKQFTFVSSREIQGI